MHTCKHTLLGGVHKTNGLDLPRKPNLKRRSALLTPHHHRRGEGQKMEKIRKLTEEKLMEEEHQYVHVWMCTALGEQLLETLLLQSAFVW